MSDVLQEARRQTSSNGELPFAIQLELYVDDRDVVAELEKHPEGPERDEFAIEALKIGVLALRRASTAFDGEFIQRETSRLLDSLRQQLDEHSRSSHERLNHSLKEYFDPQDGRFSQRVQSLTAADGDLAQAAFGLPRWRRLAAVEDAAVARRRQQPADEAAQPRPIAGPARGAADERRDATWPAARAAAARVLARQRRRRPLPAGEGTDVEARRPVEGPARRRSTSS